MMGTPDKFAMIFEYLMKLSHSRPLTLFIDEFQEFLRVNNSIYWDLQKDGAQMNLVICGSVNTLMNGIFRDYKQPLFGRQTQFMKLGPFVPSVLKVILQAYCKGFTPDDLLALYTFTSGVAKYVQQLMDNGVTTKDAMCQTRIGGWWDRKGENEIDLIGMDELEHTIDFYEVKRQQKEYDEKLLGAKTDKFLSLHSELNGYKSSIFGLTLEDI